MRRGGGASRRRRRGRRRDLHAALRRPRLHGGAELHGGLRPRREVRRVRADAVRQERAEPRRHADRASREQDHGVHDVSRRRPRPEGGAGLREPGRAGGDGPRPAREADVAARGGLHPRPVPAHGAHSREGRPRPGRQHRRLVLPQHLAVDPRAARLGARRQGRQPGHRGRADPALQPRRPADRVRDPSFADPGRVLAIGRRVAQHVRRRVDDRRARRGRRPGSVPVPARPADRPALDRGARRRRRARQLGAPRRPRAARAASPSAPRSTASWPRWWRSRPPRPPASR